MNVADLRLAPGGADRADQLVGPLRVCTQLEVVDGVGFVQQL